MLRKLAVMTAATAALLTWAAAVPAVAQTGWALQSVSNPTSQDDFFGVSCASAASCMAVGNQTASGTTTPLAEYWNGSTWATQSTPDPSGISDASFSAVSCTSTSSCTAVGYTSAGTLAEYWNGSTWTAQTTPGSSGSQLTGVSCTSSSSCTAVGFSSTTTLADYWNGSTWTAQTTSDSSSSEYLAVSCTSASSCMAVGDHFGRFVTSALADYWNGSTWTAQSLSGTTGTYFFGVSCTSSTSCMVAGSTENYAVADAWNGSTWSLTPMANGTTFTSVSCVSASDCVAAGGTNPSSGQFDPLAEYWNGSSWAAQTTASPGGEFAVLYGISCPSAADCTAGGEWYSSSPADAQAFAEQWTS